MPSPISLTLALRSCWTRPRAHPLPLGRFCPRTSARHLRGISPGPTQPPSTRVSRRSIRSVCIVGAVGYLPTLHRDDRADAVKQHDGATISRRRRLWRSWGSRSRLGRAHRLEGVLRRRIRGGQMELESSRHADLQSTATHRRPAATPASFDTASPTTKHLARRLWESHSACARLAFNGHSAHHFISTSRRSAE